MKKLFLLLAVASLALISCNKDENEDTQSQQQTITLHASVDLSNLGTRVAPNASDLAGSGDVNFHWEEGDQVTISNNSESSTFTVKASTINGNSADFEGVALSDMSNYTVSYNQNATTVAYTDGTFKPVCSGTGNNTNFYINTFQPVIKLQLTGSVTLGKIEYWTGATSATTTLTFSPGLTLTSTAQTVYFPVTAASTSGLTFKFYDNAATPELIMEKTTSSNVEEGKITTFTDELEVKKPKNVLLPGDFSVSATKTVKFSQGNLYYDGSTGTWDFEANQYDYRTYAGQNSCIDGTVSTTGTPANNWGTFGWVGASSTVLTADLTKYGMSTSTTASDYGTSTSDALYADWADISTLPQVSGRKWKTLTGGDTGEWYYLLYTRKVTVSSQSKASYGEGSVNGVNGLIILPDNWDGTVYSGFTYGASSWTNTFTESTTPKWSDMENAGCVFLPAAGYRYGSRMFGVGSYGDVWSSTPRSSDSFGACYLSFSSSSVDPTNYSSRSLGYSVRLVSAAQ